MPQKQDKKVAGHGKPATTPKNAPAAKPMTGAKPSAKPPVKAQRGK